MKTLTPYSGCKIISPSTCKSWSNPKSSRSCLFRPLLRRFRVVFKIESEGNLMKFSLLFMWLVLNIQQRYTYLKTRYLTWKKPKKKRHKFIFAILYLKRDTMPWHLCFWKVSFSSVHTNENGVSRNFLSGRHFWKFRLPVTVFARYVWTGRQSGKGNLRFESKTNTCGRGLGAIQNFNFQNLGEKCTLASMTDNIRHPKWKAYELTNAIFNNTNYDKWECYFERYFWILNTLFWKFQCPWK